MYALVSLHLLMWTVERQDGEEWLVWMDFDDRWTISSSFQLVIGKFWSDFWL